MLATRFASRIDTSVSMKRSASSWRAATAVAS
jgi:hypothetical protein